MAQHAIPTGLAIEEPFFRFPLSNEESLGKGSALESLFEYIVYCHSVISS
jgi:hypothetical protein